MNPSETKGSKKLFKVAVVEMMIFEDERLEDVSSSTQLGRKDVLDIARMLLSKENLCDEARSHVRTWLFRWRPTNFQN